MVSSRICYRDLTAGKLPPVRKNRNLARSAATPPVETNPPSNKAVVEMQLGHMEILLARWRSLRLAAFGQFFGACVHIAPATDYTLAVIIFNEAKRDVAKLDERAAGFFAEAVLDVGANGIRHEERAVKFEERGALDGLHGRPEVTVAGAEVAKPTAA